MRRGTQFASHHRLVFSAVLALLFCRASLPGLHFATSATQAVSDETLRVDVDLVALEVIAVDKKGKLVPDMRKDDFRLFEDGKEQPLISLDPVRSRAEEGSARRSRLTLILFDDGNITPAYTQLAREVAERHVKQHMRTGYVFGVAVYERALRVTQNFTPDASKVIAALHLPATSLAATGARAPFPGLRERESLTGNRRRPIALGGGGPIFPAVSIRSHRLEWLICCRA